MFVNKGELVRQKSEHLLITLVSCFIMFTKQGLKMKTIFVFDIFFVLLTYRL